MRIHRVRSGENTQDIAKEYGIDEAILCKSNEIEKGDLLSEGEELLVTVPTRTYTAKDGDSVTGVALRFDVPISELWRMNPHLVSDKLNKGEILSVKRDERPYGMGAANGVYYKGCPKWRLMRALPYTTYITVGSGIYDGERCYESFNGGEIADIALKNGKLPLLRVYDKSGGGFTKTAKGRRERIDDLIFTAMKGGYRGIDLAGCSFGEGYEDFLVELRGRMIGLDLILISEITADSPIYASDFSDGAILSIDKCGFGNDFSASFDEYEQKEMERFSGEGESTKTFVELPAFALIDGSGFTEVEDAIKSARRSKAATRVDINTLICSFSDKKRGEVRYNSLSGIIRRLELLAELGYMGISFDIGRFPIQYLLAYDSLFKSVGYANVEGRARCNSDSQEINI